MSLQLVPTETPPRDDAPMREAAARTVEVFEDIEAVLTRLLLQHMRSEEFHFDGTMVADDSEIYPLPMYLEGVPNRLTLEQAVGDTVDGVMGLLFASVPGARRKFMGEEHDA